MKTECSYKIYIFKREMSILLQLKYVTLLISVILVRAVMTKVTSYYAALQDYVSQSLLFCYAGNFHNFR